MIDSLTIVGAGAVALVALLWWLLRRRRRKAAPTGK